MGILPVLLVIIAIVSVVSNYNKIAKQRLEDQRKRMEKKQSAKKHPAAEKENIPYSPRSVPDPTLSQPILRKTAPVRETVKPRVSVKSMQNAVIMAEILNKPVSLRKK